MRVTTYVLIFRTALFFWLLMPSAGRATPPPVDAEILETRLRMQEQRIRELEARMEALMLSQQAVVPPSPSTARENSGPQQSLVNLDGLTIKARGRLQIDALLVNTGGPGTPIGTQLRRFNMGVEGKIPGGFRYIAEAGFAGTKVALEDVLIGYQLDPSSEIVAGYFKPSITADDMTSDLHTLFLERSAYAGVFAPGRRVGFGIHHAGRTWGLRAGLFGERDDASLDGDRHEGWTASARFHANLLTGADILHFAVAGYYTEPSSTDHLVFLSQKPEANRALTAIATGNFTASNGVFAGGELAYARGPLLVQAEGGMIDYHDTFGGPRFWGGSVQASWRITGEARPYDVKSGSFGRVVPNHPLSDGGTGAFELGLRVTQVDLNDDLIVGGKLTSLGWVANWYPVTRLRFSTNLIHSSTERPGVEDLQQFLLVLRAAVDW